MTTPNARTASFVAATLVAWLVLTTLLLVFMAGRASAQPGCTSWTNPSPGTTTIYSPGDYASFVLHLEDGTSVEVGPVVLGQVIELDQPATGATKCQTAPEPGPTPEPTPDKTPDPEPTPAPPEDPTYVTACGMAEVVAIGDGWTYQGTPIVKGHVLNDGDTIVHESGATYTFVAPTEDWCTEVVVPTPTPDVVIPPPPEPPVCHEWQPCWDCTVDGNGICGPDEPPAPDCELPDCLPKTGADLEARWGLLFLAAGGSMLAGSWVLNADRRAVRRYRKAGRS
jgi:hypothetical protein